MMPPRTRSEEIDEEMKESSSNKRKREIQEEDDKGKQVIRYDHHRQDCNDNFSFEPPRLPNWIIQPFDQLPWRMKKIIEDDMQGRDIKLVMEKTICTSDLSSHGFFVPENQVLKEARDFLNPYEVEYLKKINSMTNENNKPQAISVLLLDQNLQEFDLFLSWRQMNSTYNLTGGGWNDVVGRNGLKLHDTVQLWSFRRVCDNKLGFAIVKA